MFLEHRTEHFIDTLIANVSANSDGRNQTQNCSFNTNQTALLFTKYQIENSNIQAAQITLKKDDQSAPSPLEVIIAGTKYGHF